MTVTEVLEIAATTITGLGGGGAIVFGLSNYLGKVWADRALEQQRQENARLNLALTHQLGLLTEQTRHALQITAFEHQIRFSKLHEKRAEVIAGVYKRIVGAEQEGGRFVLVEGFDDGTDRQQEAWRKIEATLWDVTSFIEEHRIYLPERVCALLKAFLDTMRENLYGVGVYSSIEHPTPKTQAEKHAVLIKAYNVFRVDIPAAKLALEDEFRAILGVEAAQPPATTA